MKHDNIQWIFFDVGGVLLDDSQAETFRQEAILKIVNSFGKQLHIADIRSAWMEASKIPGPLRINTLRQLLTNDDQYETALKELTASLPIDHYPRLSIIRPEAKDVLTQLKRHYSLGIIANQSATVIERMADAGILESFKHQKVSAHHGLEKPNPEYYKMVLRDTGADPHTSAFVDDNWYRGLQPGQKLGMTSVLFMRDTTPYPETADPDYKIESLTELLEIFKLN